MIESALHRLARVPETEVIGSGSRKAPLQQALSALRPSNRTVRFIGAGVAIVAFAAGINGLTNNDGDAPSAVAVAFYDDLDFRRFESSWERLDPGTRPTLSDYLVRLSIEDGLLASYASLDSIGVVAEVIDGDRAVVEIVLTYVTALAEYRSVETLSLRRTEGRWGIELPPSAAGEPVERLARRSSVDFAPMGRRTVTSATTEYDDVLDRPNLEVTRARLVLFDGHPVAIGEVGNVDADPAAVTVTTQLIDGNGQVAAAYNAARVIQHSLLPGETTPYRVDFEGVAGASGGGSFDPEAFVPVDPIADLTGLDVYAKAIVTGRGLERPIVLHDLAVGVGAAGTPLLSGSILNLGVEDATVVALLVSLYDPDGSLIWVDWVILSDAVGPGLATSFTASLTSRHRIAAVDAPSQAFVNGLRQEPGAVATGTIEMPAESGFGGLTVQPVTFVRSTGG